MPPVRCWTFLDVVVDDSRRRRQRWRSTAPSSLPSRRRRHEGERKDRDADQMAGERPPCSRLLLLDPALHCFASALP